MDFKLLHCFVAAADELHFGRAARRLDMQPSALGRNIKMLEEELGIRLFERSTRNVELTSTGYSFLGNVKELLRQADMAFAKARENSDAKDRVFRIGAIDSAATGLLPELVHDFKKIAPELELALVEDKTAKLLPRMQSGALDIAFVRPPSSLRPQFEFDHLLYEPTVVALPKGHPLTKKTAVQVPDLAEIPLIVPSPRNRPHSYHLTMRLFNQAGLRPIIAQQAEEKQTIVNLVGAGVGAALVPFWTSKIGIDQVEYRPLIDVTGEQVCELPLAMAWVKGTGDEYRERLMKIVHDKIRDSGIGLATDANGVEAS